MSAGRHEASYLSIKKYFFGLHGDPAVQGSGGKLQRRAIALFSQKADVREGRASSFPLALTVFISALLAAFCLCLMAETAIMSLSLAARFSLAEDIANRPPSFANAKTGRGMDSFTELNPFGASRRQAADKESSYSAASLVLAGTLPQIGAWIRDDAGTHLVLKGQVIRGSRLEDISYGRVLLSQNGNIYPLYLTLSGGKAASPPPPPPAAGGKQGSGADLSEIKPASEGQEGVVPRELVDKLVMDPYDELSKMRMVPAEGGGMQLQRIAPDSVLGVVGVSQGDVIKAINGVNISNLSDAANAVNSLMSGTRFDVTVERDGKPLSLKYQVK